MKTLLLSSLAVAAIAAATPGLASQTVPAANAPQAQKAPTKALTRAAVAQNVQKRFSAIDTNRDGFVTEAESDAAAKRVHDRVEQRLDKRGDAAFAKLDSNKDGSVNRTEADAAVRGRSTPKAGGKPIGWDRIAPLDANKDGAISRAEFDSAQERRADRRGARVDRMFENADANKDGRVSLAEATAAATAQFDLADKNRDGTLTREEIIQSRRVAR